MAEVTLTVNRFIDCFVCCKLRAIIVDQGMYITRYRRLITLQSRLWQRGVVLIDRPTKLNLDLRLTSVTRTAPSWWPITVLSTLKRKRIFSGLPHFLGNKQWFSIVL